MMDWRGLLTVILILIREEEGADFSSARSSSSYGALYGPQKAIDGKISKMHRDFFGSQMEDNPWLEVSMPDGFIKGVEIVTRWGCCADRVKNIEFRAGRESVPRRFKGRLTSNTKVATFVGPADANFQTYRVDFDHNVLAKYVTLQRIGTGVYLEINEIRMITLEVEDFSSARSSSSYFGAFYGPLKAIDGEISKTNYNFFGSQMENNPWLEVSMPEGYIKGVEIVTRCCCCADRVKNIEFRAGMDSVPNGFKGRLTFNTKVATFVGPANANLKTYRVDFDESVLAKYVTLQRFGRIGTRVTLEINELRMITLREDFSSARSSSSYGASYGALTAIDGKISEEHRNFFCSQPEDNPWLEVSMPEGFIKGVEIVTRWGCCADRVKNIEFRAGRESVPIGFKGKLTVNTKVATFVGPADANLKTYRVDFDESVLAKYVTLQRIGTRVTLEINEVTMIR